jgi:Skp family chaperone for outer membrane proteins
MKKLLLVALLGVSAAVLAHKDLTTTEITPENCIECIKAGTPKNAVAERIKQMQESGDITAEQAENCLKAIEATEVAE